MSGSNAAAIDGQVEAAYPLAPPPPRLRPRPPLFPYTTLFRSDVATAAAAAAAPSRARERGHSDQREGSQDRVQYCSDRPPSRGGLPPSTAAAAPSPPTAIT